MYFAAMGNPIFIGIMIRELLFRNVLIVKIQTYDL
jgi:hypothetical protein